MVTPDMVTPAMIEAAAIALFDHDEDLNVAFVARCDAEGNRAPGDAMGRERDRWQNHDAKLHDAFRARARAALTAAFAAGQPGFFPPPATAAGDPAGALHAMLEAWPGDAVIEPGEVPGSDGADMFHHPP